MDKWEHFVKLFKQKFSGPIKISRPLTVLDMYELIEMAYAEYGWEQMKKAVEESAMNKMIEEIKKSKQ